MKIMKIIGIVIIFFLSTPVFAFDKWDRTDYALLAVSTLTMGIDWRQTRRIAEQPERYYETNPIIGRHPSLDRVDQYFAISWIIKAGIAYILPSQWRKVWLGGIIGVETGCVFRNTNIGLGISW